MTTGSLSSSARRGLVRCSVAAVLFGASAPLASRLAGQMPAFTLAGLLYLGAGLATAPVVIRRRPSAMGLRAGGGRLTLAVVFGGALGPVLLATGLARTSAASASLLLNLELAFTVLLAGLLFREHLGGRLVQGTVLVVVAGLVLGWSGDPSVRWGAVLIAAACLCWAVDNGVTAELDQLSPATITFVKGAAAGTVNVLIGLAVGAMPPTTEILAALAVGVVGYGLSITLWVAGARDLGAARGQLVFASAPFIGAIVAWVGLGEPVTGRQVVAVVVAAGGVSVVLRSGHEHEHAHQPLDHEHEHDHDDGHHDHHDDRPAPRRHTHRHVHRDLVHAHPHVPDLHHRHGHG